MNKFYYYKLRLEKVIIIIVFIFIIIIIIIMSCVGAPFDMKTKSKPKHFEEKMIGVLLETT